jgi:hypothetical protein
MARRRERGRFPSWGRGECRGLPRSDRAFRPHGRSRELLDHPATAPRGRRASPSPLPPPAHHHPPQVAPRLPKGGPFGRMARSRSPSSRILLKRCRMTPLSSAGVGAGKPSRMFFSIVSVHSSNATLSRLARRRLARGHARSLPVRAPFQLCRVLCGRLFRLCALCRFQDRRDMAAFSGEVWLPFVDEYRTFITARQSRGGPAIASLSVLSLTGP